MGLTKEKENEPMEKNTPSKEAGITKNPLWNNIGNT